MAVTFDATSNGTSHAATPASPLTLTSLITIATAGGIAVVGIAIGNVNTSNITAVTLGGSTVTKLTSRESNDSTAGGIWLGYVVGLSTGAKNLVITFTGSPSSLIAGAVALKGQDATTPLGSAVTAVGSSVNPSVGVTTSVAGDMVVDAMADGSGLPGTTHNQSLRWQDPFDGSSAAGLAGQATAAGASGTVTMTYTIASSDFWAIAAVPVKQSSGTPVGGESLYAYPKQPIQSLLTIGEFA
jgi:hypothetical protein